MQKYQAKALEAMFVILEKRAALDTRMYARGQPTVVVAVFEYFDELLTGGEQDLRLVAPETVLEITREDYQCTVALYKGDRKQSFVIGNTFRFNARTSDDTMNEFFNQLITSMVSVVGFEAAIDASADYKANSMLVAHTGSCVNRPLGQPNIKYKKKRVLVTQ